MNNLREIQALRRLSPHEHIITLEEVLYDQPTGRLALVFELMDANLYELIRGKRKVSLLFSSFLIFFSRSTSLPQPKSHQIIHVAVDEVIRSHAQERNLSP